MSDKENSTMSVLIQGQIELRQDMREMTSSIKEMATSISALARTMDRHDEKFINQDSRLKALEKAVEKIHTIISLLQEKIAPNTITRQIISAVAKSLLPMMIGGALAMIGSFLLNGSPNP